ncbi:MAG: ABC transporter ATP-binding protein [Actinomycetota bacterium]|nr:ABC transporter ATP-binding protein [Actinomycetota bacterium]
MTASLRLEQLSRTYPGALTPAVNEIDLAIDAGHAVALLGPSGSGKTTVLRLIAGLDAPDHGNILINETSVLGRSPERRDIAMVSQRPLLFPHMSVLDNVAFAPRMAGIGKRQSCDTAMRFLELVQLPGFGKRRPTELSGGQQQRVALARALAAEPAVLLLDEPFSALDPALKADMHQLLVELRAVLQQTIVMVTHDHHEAVLLADSIAVVIDGVLQQHTPAEALFAHPESLAVSRFLGGLNEIPGELRGNLFHCAIGALDLAKDHGCAHGSAVMVIRQEAVRLVGESSVDADTCGRIQRTVPLGARTLVEVRTCDLTLFAEVAPGLGAQPGDVVGVALPRSQRRVLRDCAEAQPLTAGSAEVAHAL